MAKKILKMLCLLLCSTIYSQNVDSDSLINGIKKDVTDFFITKKILNPDVVKNDLDYVLIIEINNHKVIGYDKNGIYTIAVYKSHSERHLLIKNDTNYKILDIRKIDNVLKEVIDFAQINHLSQDDMLSYMKRVIQMYDDNYNSSYTAKKASN